ncbi:MAG: efflux RND transporter permease subunit [Sphingobacteriales bacterium]|nr:efflux RND transporter permease subunit [Sphingobacteriales bacterium]
MFDYFYKRPYLLYAIIFGFLIVGILALVTLPKNLFPDSTPPQVLVITKIPGATAQVAANSVSKPIEEEIARLGLIKDVSSINVANFSIVKAEFEYEKGLDAAAVDVANALSIAKGNLPSDVNPSVYTTGDFTLPVDVISVSPKNKSVTLADIRKIVDGVIKPQLLSNTEIGNVEVFGGYESAINIEVDPYKTKQYNIEFAQIVKVLQTINHDIPVGLIKGKEDFYTITYYGENDNIEKIKQINIIPNVTINDIASVEWAYKKRTSGYIGNGKPAIALAIQRAPSGSVLGVSNAAREELKKLEAQYPNFQFEISDTQRNLIELANDNMLLALRDAIFFTLLVILLFIGNLKAITAAAISIPLVFFSTLAVIWFTGGSLNIVIYTGIILALGMLADDAIVVLENIERHLNELGEDLKTAVQKGTKEVVSPIWSGTIATIAIMTPLMFVGGFPEKIFKPLVFTLIIALLVSYFLSITFIPKILEYLLRNGHSKNRVELWFEKLYEKSFGRLVQPYVNVIHFSNNGKKLTRRIILTLGVVVLLLVSLRSVMPVIGRDAMPPMDTGIVKAQIGFSANETVESAETKIKPFLAWLHQQPWVEKSSVAFGNETGVLSLGSGNLPTEATITINCVDRFSRAKNLWELEDEIRNKIAELEGVKRNEVFDFGATALSTIKATLDVRLKSHTVDGLSEQADEVKDILTNIHGLTSVSTSWDKDFSEFALDIDKAKVLSYGITPQEIVSQLLIKGQVVSLNANLQSLNAQPVTLFFKGKFSENAQALRLIPIKTPNGDVPLEQLASLKKQLTFAKIERNKMLYSVDINGYRKDRPVTHITDEAEVALSKIKENSEVVVTQEGDIAQINDSFSRMMKAIALGIFILFMVLISIYKSVKLSLIMIIVLPLSLIGATWGMLLFHKPSCLPSLLGILLLFGIIIKNSILLIDFYQHHRDSGESPFESAVESVKVRFRPVMMTAFATIAGMVPIAMEHAVGLERLSPLADVAIGGLLIGTLLTLVFVPIYAYTTDKNK